MKIVVVAVVSVLFHLLLGWQWTIVAGVFGGLLSDRRGWLLGGLGVGLSWLGLVIYNFAMALEPMQRMIDTMGGILGGLPGFVIVALTILIGLLLGLVGGGIGTQVRAFLGIGRQLATES